MTQRISKHGTRYTEGSSSTPAAEMPRVCETCGQRILTSRQSFEHRVEVGPGGAFTHRAWHLPRCPEKDAA